MHHLSSVHRLIASTFRARTGPTRSVSRSTQLAAPTAAREIELKLRIPALSDFQRLARYLVGAAEAPGKGRVHASSLDDHFFDGVDRPMWIRDSTVLRIRRSGSDVGPWLQGLGINGGQTEQVDRDRAVRWKATVKMGCKMQNGVMSSMEMESSIPEAVGLSLLRSHDHAKEGSGSIAFIDNVAKTYSIDRFVRVGGYRTNRISVDVRGDGMKVELDETTYDFGCGYEVEVETSDPGHAELVLSKVFDKLGIPRLRSTKNKFDIMNSRLLH